jgi:hypothetical protein
MQKRLYSQRTVGYVEQLLHLFISLRPKFLQVFLIGRTVRECALLRGLNLHIAFRNALSSSDILLLHDIERPAPDYSEVIPGLKSTPFRRHMVRDFTLKKKYCAVSSVPLHIGSLWQQ